VFHLTQMHLPLGCYFPKLQGMFYRFPKLPRPWPPPPSSMCITPSSTSITTSFSTIIFLLSLFKVPYDYLGHTWITQDLEILNLIIFAQCFCTT
jgi:hypothetical protein